jgi:hypothetical protein
MVTSPATQAITVEDAKATKNANHLKYGRYDSVLLKWTGEHRTPKHRVYSMSNWKVAHLLALFKCKSDNGALQLAFVNLYAIAGTPKDGHCHGLYLVRKTSRFQVVPVTDIESDVHLIPKFGNRIRVAVTVNKTIKQRLSENHTLAERLGGDKVVNQGRSLNKSDLIMDHYKQFWLNSWLDSHIYKNIN